MARFVVHNAREELVQDSDIWLVIDTVEGTAVSQNSDRQAAEDDWVLLTAFYNQHPDLRPTYGAASSLGLQGSAPLFSPGRWKGHCFGR